ncbi:MAG: sn-glycerol-3-phosphate ABC transporter ATP-binding protein UgpC [Pseudomonadota bacterium]
MASIRIEALRKVYPGGVVALPELDLEIEDGEFVVLVGPSGCGKSTALKMIAGLEEVTDGRVVIGDEDVTDAAPKDRDIAMVFQNYALYPHLSVRRNMGFALKMRGMPPEEINRRVESAAKSLGIDHLLDRRPRQLSGGQRQRVALGRAIVREPRAFLMDEPLSNLDAKLRVQMRAEIGALHNRLKVTTIYVTHDQVEAMTMADRIVIMRDGVVQQIASSDDMYAKPTNVFVAGFIGSPAMNFFRSTLERDEDGFSVKLGDLKLPAPISAESGATHAGAPVIAGLRPEHLGVGGNGRSLPYQVTPTLVESLGGERYLHFPIPEENAIQLESAGDVQDAGGRRMIARVLGDVHAKEGQELQLEIDPSKLHLFAPDSEEAIH